MSTKHTSGPWFFNELNGQITNDEGTPIGEAFDNLDSGNDSIDDLPSASNGHLMAASPDLLLACLEFVRKVDAGEAKSTRSYQQMKAAIAKAGIQV